MGERLQLTITFDEPDEDGWIVARVIEVPGAISQGRSRAEARVNLIDALRLMLSPDDDDQRIADGRSEPLELTQFFEGRPGRRRTNRSSLMRGENDFTADIVMIYGRSSAKVGRRWPGTSGSSRRFSRGERIASRRALSG